MKAQMKKLIDVDDLIKSDDYPKNGNGDFDFEIAPCDDSCDCKNEPTENETTEEVPAYVSRMINEYHELKDKYTKLHRMLVKSMKLEHLTLSQLALLNFLNIKQM